MNFRYRGLEAYRPVQKKTSTPKPFPKLPVKQKLVRQLYKCDLGKIPQEERELVKEYLPCAKSRFFKPLKSLLPRTILVRTHRPVGFPICGEYRVIYSYNLLLDRLGWMRELFFSPSSVPVSCLRYFARLLASNISHGS